MRQFRRRVGRRPLLAGAAAFVLALGALVAPGASADTATAIDLQPESTQQTMDGFGFSAAFQRTGQLEQLSDAKRAEATELLLGDSGVDPSILRLGIGGQSTPPYDWMLSIQPTDPGGPAATPQYTWDGKDNGQVWFAKAAQDAGVEYIYGNAWTAPGYMKTNNNAANGGVLCGLSGTTCASGDWKTAYANYLVAWADFYEQEGVTIDGLAFTNEPDYTSNYESMRFTPTQAAEFVKTFGPIADAAGYDTVCCESFGWNQGKNYHSAVMSDPDASKWIDILTAHSYASRSDSPYETAGSLWMSEWASSATGGPFNPNWDQGSPGVATDGIKMADHMMDSLTRANVTGYLWWLGVSQGASASLMVVDVPNDTYSVASRLYGMAAFSRFIRPEAVRFDAVHSVAGLKVAAFDNADGSRVVQLLNTTFDPIESDIDLDSQPTAYLNDQTHELAVSDTVAVTADGKTNLSLPARSLVTLVLEPEAPEAGDGIPLRATVDEAGPGFLTMTVAEYGERVDLGQGVNLGDRLRFEAALPIVTVTDSRNAEQAGEGGWALTGQSSDFVNGSETITANHLGWTPSLTAPRAGQSAGSAVATVLDGGPGLAVPASLATADSTGRTGSTAVGASLRLDAPVDAAPGQYDATLAVSLFPVD